MRFSIDGPIVLFMSSFAKSPTRHSALATARLRRTSAETLGVGGWVERIKKEDHFIMRLFRGFVQWGGERVLGPFSRVIFTPEIHARPAGGALNPGPSP